MKAGGCVDKKSKIEIAIILGAELFLIISCIVDFFTFGQMLPDLKDSDAALKFIGLSAKIIVVVLIAGLGLAIWGKRKIDDLKRKNQQLDALTANVPGGVICCLCDPEFTISHMSDSFVNLTGYSREEIAINFDSKFIRMIFPKDRHILSEINAKNKNDTYEAEYRMLRKTGQMLWILENGKMINEGGKLKYYSVLVDITETKRAQQEIERTKKELEISNERYKIVMDQSDSIIFEFDIGKKHIYFSGRFFDKFGYYASESNFPASFLNDGLIHPDDEEKFISFYNRIFDGEHFVTDEHRIMSVVNGEREYIWCSVKATIIIDDNGNPLKAIGRLKDITVRKAEQTRNITSEQTDALTGLLNRETFEAFSDTALSENKDSNYAILIIDIKNFKYFNDLYGYKSSEKILCRFAENLEKMFRSSDIVARMAGDVFAVFLKSPTEKIIVQKINEISGSLLKLTPSECSEKLTCRIGVALYPDDAGSAEELYYNAETALKYLKRNENKAYCFYSEI